MILSLPRTAVAIALAGLLVCALGSSSCQLTTFSELTTFQSWTERSIVQIKTFKTSSSSLSGVLRGIAKRRGLSGFKADHTSSSLLDVLRAPREPGIWANHATRRSMQIVLDKHRVAPFVVASVRHPIQRSMSLYYHTTVSRGGVAPTVSGKISTLMRHTSPLSYYMQPPDDCLTARLQAVNRRTSVLSNRTLQAQAQTGLLVAQNAWDTHLQRDYPEGDALDAGGALQTPSSSRDQPAGRLHREPSATDEQLDQEKSGRGAELEGSNMRKLSAATTTGRESFLRSIWPDQATVGRVTPRARAILSFYDFVLVADRPTESFVLLADALSVPLHWVAHIAAKNSSKPHLDDTGKPFHRHPPIEEEDPEVIELVQSSKYRQMQATDLVLVSEAERQLDQRAAMIPDFETRCRRFEAMQSLVARECQEVPPCHWNDNGCGYVCLERLEARLQAIGMGGFG